MNSSTLRRLSINQLRSMASGHGLAHTVRSTKNDLIAVLSALINEPAFTPDRTPARSGREGARKESLFLSSVPPDLASPAPSSSSSSASVPLFGPPPHQPELSDPGLPIPPSYGRDRLVLMVLDTTHLFAYWEISGPTLSRVHIAIGDTTLMILVVRTGTGSEYHEIEFSRGSHYLPAIPGAHCLAELAARDGQGVLHTIICSNRVIIPSPVISTRMDEQWWGQDGVFHELLKLSEIPGPIQPLSSSERLANRHPDEDRWHLVHGGFTSASLSSHILSSGALAGSS